MICNTGSPEKKLSPLSQLIDGEFSLTENDNELSVKKS